MGELTGRAIAARRRRARGRGRSAPAEVALLASVFVVAACGLVYELAAGTLASYLLGDSILQFSTVIGTYLFAMGVGSWLSRYFERQLVAHFLRIELLVGLVGGLMPAALFALQSLRGAVVPLRAVRAGARGRHPGRARDPAGDAHPEAPRPRRDGARRTLVSQVLTFDYLGALAVSIAFPLLLVPQLGLIRTGAVLRPAERRASRSGRCGCFAPSCARFARARRWRAR